MTLKFDADYLSHAVEDRQLPEKMNIKLVRHNIDTIKITSGQLVACDPGFLEFKSPFVTKIPMGEYSVRITIAHDLNDADENITFATIHLGDSKVVRWELMLLPEQNISQLHDDQFFGYGVDTGIGCFTDFSVVEYIKSQKLGNETYIELRNNMTSLGTRLRAWGSMNVKNGNIVAFASGWGDGAYPTFIGFNETDQITAIVTDFMCIYNDYYEIEDDEE